MPRGGARIGAGRPRKSAPKTDKQASTLVVPQSADNQTAPPRDPIEFLESVMIGTVLADQKQITAAIALAKYQADAGKAKGKKDAAKEAAEKAHAGRFGAMQAPLRVVGQK